MPRALLYLAPILALACARPDERPRPAEDGPESPAPPAPAESKATPERDPDDVLRDIVQIEVVLHESMCALDAGGSVYCWGEWGRAAEREADRTERFVRPHLVHGLPKIRQLGPFGPPIAVAEDGSLFEWELDPAAPVLRARPMGKSIPPTASLRPDGRVAVVALDAVEVESARKDLLGVVQATRGDHEDDFLCYVEVSGQVHCALLWPPRPEAPGKRFRLPGPAVSIGGGGSNGDFIAVLEDGRTATWGPELEVLVRDTPKLVQASRENVHSCGVDQAGDVHCWQERAEAKDANSAAPQQVAGAGPARAVTALPVSACALQTNGTVKCWGENWHGECGVNAGEPVPIPRLVLAPTKETSDG